MYTHTDVIQQQTMAPGIFSFLINFSYKAEFFEEIGFDETPTFSLDFYNIIK